LERVQAKSVKYRLRFIFLIILLLVVCGEAAIRYWIELPQIQAIQVESDKKDFKRVVQAIKSSLKSVQVWSYDYGVWEDTYNYMEDVGEGVQYINKNYVFGTFHAAGLSGVKLITQKRRTKFECEIIFEDEQCDQHNVSNIEPIQLDAIINHLDSVNQDAVSSSGIYITDEVPHLYGISKITNPTNNQQSGYLIFFQKMDKVLIEQWRSETQLGIDVKWAKNERYSVLSNNMFDDINQNYSYINDNGYLSFSLPDINGNNLISISFKADSEQTKQAFISLTLILGVSAGLAIPLLYFRLISREVVKPMEYISSELNRINETSNYQYKFPRFNTLEVNLIVSAFNRLLERVQYQQEQLREKNESLQLVARQDYLTGLANRRHMDKLSERLWYKTVKANESFCVCMIDCDYFKQYNDHYGHKKGDELLIKLASLLIEIEGKHTNVIACRYGGDELVLLAYSLPVEMLESILAELKEQLLRLDIKHESSYLGRVSVSVGFYHTLAVNEIEANPFFIKADKALYLAKKLGRNTIVNYHNMDN